MVKAEPAECQDAAAAGGVVVAARAVRDLPPVEPDECCRGDFPQAGSDCRDGLGFRAEPGFRAVQQDQAAPGYRGELDLQAAHWAVLACQAAAPGQVAGKAGQ